MSRKTVKFGINPLLRGPSLEERVKSGSPYRLLPLSEVDVDPDQPRRMFDPESLAELSASILEHGVLCPILVSVGAGGTYRIVSGERRYRAAKMAGLETIPAIVDSDNGDEKSRLSKQLVENLQREDLSAMERAIAIGQLRDQFALSLRDIAKSLGVSKSLVQRSLEVLSLPDDLQAALISGASESKVLLLAEISDKRLRSELLSRLGDYTREELVEELRRIRGEGGACAQVSHRGTKRKGKAKTPALSIEDRRLVDELQKALRTKVHLSREPKKENSGKLTLEFYSSEDLAEIYRRLLAGA